jgi:hypothetical protein
VLRGAIQEECSAIDPFPMEEAKTYEGKDLETMLIFLSPGE